MFKTSPKLKNIFVMGFLLSLHLAFTSYVNSTYLATFAGEEKIGLIYMLSSISSILFLLWVPKMLQRFGAHKFLLATSGLNILALLLLSQAASALSAIPVFIFYFTLNNLIIFAMDELLEIFSKNTSTGQIRGLFLTVMNIAWVLSQTFSGRTLTSTSFATIYTIGLIMMAGFFLTSLASLKDLEDPKYDKAIAWQSFKKFFASKKLARAYRMSFLLQFFFAIMVIYTPIYLYAHLGFSWSEIGTMFAIMLLPFVLFQYPLGRRADKVGERDMLIAGFFMLSASTIGLYFITLHEVWVWALALFATRAGAAIVEVMADVYFFKHIKSENDEFISVYRTTGPLSYVLAPLAASLILLLTPSFEYLFLVLGAITFYGIYAASTIRKNDL